MSGQKFTWTGARERAALMVAEDELTDAEIAEAVGISRQGLVKWKQHPEFQARIAEHVKTLEASVMRYAIAKKRKRVERLNRDWLRIQQVFDERAEEMGNEAAGGSTGILQRTVKVVGAGSAQQTIEEYSIDTAALRELRGLEEQAAKETGQWVEKSELTVDDAGLTDDDRAARIAQILDTARARRARQTPEAAGAELDAAAGAADAGLRERG